jgi:hypothetical protein
MTGKAADVVSWAVTFAAITLAWALFRAQTWAQAGTLLGAALTPFSGGAPLLPHTFLVLLAVVVAGYLALEYLTGRLRGERPLLAWIPIELRYLGYAAIFYFAVFHTAAPQSFIYFQF